MKIGVLIHGCHLQAKGWEDIIWGSPQEGRLGRVPRALQLFNTDDVELLYWGTGASEKDGMKEAEYTFNYAVTHCKELSQFQGSDTYEIEPILKQISHVDTVSINTKEEISAAGALCRERGIQRLVLVSSPTHISRCLLIAEKLQAEGELSGLEIFATASDTCYFGTVPGDVVIVEPPHRGDRPQVPIHKTIARANKLGRGEKAEEFEQELSKFLDNWEE